MVRSDCGLSKNSSGSFCSTISPRSMKITRSATVRAKPISWVTHDHGHALVGELDHDVEHFLDHLRIERRGRLVEQHDLGLHAQRAGDRHALLLPAGELAGVLVGLLGNAHPLEVLHRRFPPPPPWASCGTQIGASVQVLQHRQMREQVELLEHHADIAPDGVDVLQVVGQFNAIDDDLAALMLLQPVDAADQRGFAGAGRAADDDPLARARRPG